MFKITDPIHLALLAEVHAQEERIPECVNAKRAEEPGAEEELKRVRKALYLAYAALADLAEERGDIHDHKWYRQAAERARPQ